MLNETAIFSLSLVMRLHDWPINNRKKKIHLDTHKIEYYVASPLWSTYIGYKTRILRQKRYMMKCGAIGNSLWNTWEFGEHTHTHTLKSIVFWNLFGNTKKTQKKESSAGKGVIKRVNGPLNTQILKKFKRTSLDSRPPRFQKQIPKNWSKNLPWSIDSLPVLS